VKWPPGLRTKLIIRLPVCSVFSQIMIAKENVPEEIKDDLRMIAESSQRVADIVKRLLTFARQAKTGQIIR